MSQRCYLYFSLRERLPWGSDIWNRSWTRERIWKWGIGVEDVPEKRVILVIQEWRWEIQDLWETERQVVQVKGHLETKKGVLEHLSGKNDWTKLQRILMMRAGGGSSEQFSFSDTWTLPSSLHYNFWETTCCALCFGFQISNLANFISRAWKESYVKCRFGLWSTFCRSTSSVIWQESQGSLGWCSWKNYLID